MAGNARFIEMIISELERHDGAVFREEPIIQRASSALEALPERYREMRRIGSSDASLLLNESRLFYEMGQFMEDYEDSFEYNGVFMKYFPTYRQMNDRQLRGYFSWRTAVRRGEVRETSLSFAFVYVYELINLIGAESPEDAAKKLDDFAAAYSEYDESILHYAERWRRDMSVYYGLPDEELGEKYTFELAAGVLTDPASHGDGEVFRAICALSSFNPERSKLVKSRPEAKTLIARIFRAHSAFCAEHRKTTLAERLFGRMKERIYVIFPSAVFYDRKRYTDYEYTFPSGRVCRCRGGRWSTVWYPEITKKSSALGALIKTIDGSLRPHFGLEGQSADTASLLLGKIIEREVASYIEEERRREAAIVRFDFSKLDGIRTSAEATKEMLVAEDEEEDDTETASCAEEETVDEDETPGEPSPLTSEEAKLLSLILDGGDAAAFAKRNGTMLSVAVESINEKLFDELCDTAIEFDGDTPRPVEDYIEDIRRFALK